MLKRLRELRNVLGISQKQLADVIQVSQQSINKYENHDVQPDLQTLIHLADYFNVSVDYLIEHSNQPQGAGFPPYTSEELFLLKMYRTLDDDEKQSIMLVLGNYNKKKG